MRFQPRFFLHRGLTNLSELRGSRLEPEKYSLARSDSGPTLKQ
jgi:hypothetical protein